jgi:hypothetical protein
MIMKGAKCYCTIWLSAKDTYDWAHRPGAAWPCSTLSGHRLRATIQDDDLVDLTVDGRNDYEVDGGELDAILADHGARLPR